MSILDWTDKQRRTAGVLLIRDVLYDSWDRLERRIYAKKYISAVLDLARFVRAGHSPKHN